MNEMNDEIDITDNDDISLPIKKDNKKKIK